MNIDGVKYLNGKSAIFNVKTPAGHEAEIAITTPKMWKAKAELGGQELYTKVRNKVAGWEQAQKEMEELYRNAR